MINLTQPETITSIQAIVEFMELMFPGLVCFMVFQLLSERRLNIYLNISEIFLYTIFIQLITNNRIIGALIGLLIGFGFNWLYQKERFFSFMRKAKQTNKNIEGSILWVYLHQGDDRSSIITFKNDDIIEGQIIKYSKDDNHLIVYNPVWIKRSNPSESKSIMIHLYISIDDIKYIEFKLSQKDKEKLKV